MVVYTKLVIESVEYTDAKNINVERNIGDFNAVSNFEITFNNVDGKYSNTFNLNDDVQIYAEVDTNPPTIKIFRGIIENIEFVGKSQKEEIRLFGRDYGAVLQDVSVQPTVFKNRDVGEIAKIIVEQNVENIVTTNNVDTNTGVTLERVTFAHKPIFDSLVELAKLSNYYFYVDTDKDVHFVEKGSLPSSLKAYWKFDDNADDTTVIDSTGNINGTSKWNFCQ